VLIKQSPGIKITTVKELKVDSKFDFIPSENSLMGLMFDELKDMVLNKIGYTKEYSIRDLTFHCGNSISPAINSYKEGKRVNS